MDEGVTHGPLVNQMGVDKVEAHVNESVKNGAKVLAGGKRGEGFFFEPTVLSNLPDTVVSVVSRLVSSMPSLTLVCFH